MIAHISIAGLLLALFLAAFRSGVFSRRGAQSEEEKDANLSGFHENRRSNRVISRYATVTGVRKSLNSLMVDALQEASEKDFMVDSMQEVSQKDAAPDALLQSTVMHRPVDWTEWQALWDKQSQEQVGKILGFIEKFAGTAVATSLLEDTFAPSTNDDMALYVTIFQLRHKLPVITDSGSKYVIRGFIPEQTFLAYMVSAIPPSGTGPPKFATAECLAGCPWDARDGGGYMGMLAAWKNSVEAVPGGDEKNFLDFLGVAMKRACVEITSWPEVQMSDSGIGSQPRANAFNVQQNKVQKKCDADTKAVTPVQVASTTFGF